MLTLHQVTEEGKELDTIRQLFTEYEAELKEDICFQSFSEELTNPLKKYAAPGAVFIAYWNGEPAGCIALLAPGDNTSCEMKRLYVRPAYRQHGIGRQLVERVLLEGKERNFASMKLDTLQRLQPAIHLYRQYGFNDITAQYQDPARDVVYMEKTFNTL